MTASKHGIINSYPEDDSDTEPATVVNAAVQAIADHVEDEPEDEEQPPSQATFLKYLKSPIVHVRVGSNSSATVLQVHRAVLQRSDFFAEKFDQASPNSPYDGIAFEHENPEAVASVIEYLYTNEYSPSMVYLNPGSQELGQDAPVQEPSNNGARLLRHGRVYALASKLNLPELTDLAFAKICRTTSTAQEELAYARFVYQEISRDDIRIRDPVIKFWAKTEERRMEVGSAFDELCIDCPQFALDILKVSLERRDQRKRKTPTTNAPVSVHSHANTTGSAATHEPNKRVKQEVRKSVGGKAPRRINNVVEIDESDEA